jgi:hypothetical protein
LSVDALTKRTILTETISKNYLLYYEIFKVHPVFFKQKTARGGLDDSNKLARHPRRLCGFVICINTCL